MIKLAAPHRFLSALFPFAALLATLAPVSAFAQSPQKIVEDVVWNEAHAEAEDHSRWMYRDAYSSPAKDTVRLFIQTPEANLSELIEDHGQPPTPQEHQADLTHMQQLVTDPALRARMRRNEAHDGQQADQLMKMLPTAFDWTIVSRDHGLITLAYHPDPSFTPPSMSARVLSSMSGTLVVNEQYRRLVSLTGKLLKPVEFGWGLLGHLDAGGTFQIVREQVAPGEWQIVQTHVHISGHALFFKTIGDQEDEVTSDYKPVPADVGLEKAAAMIRDGELARDLGVSVDFSR